MGSVLWPPTKVVFIVVGSPDTWRSAFDRSTAKESGSSNTLGSRFERLVGEVEPVALGDPLAQDLGVGRSRAHEVAHRRCPSDYLLDPVADEIGIVSELVELAGIFDQGLHTPPSAGHGLSIDRYVWKACCSRNCLKAQSRSRGDVHTWAMVLRQHNPEAEFPPYANYAHAVEVGAGARLLFISGLNGVESG